VVFLLLSWVLLTDLSLRMSTLRLLLKNRETHNLKFFGIYL
jgi:hypothetical protein